METFAYIVTIFTCSCFIIGTFWLLHWLGKAVREQLQEPHQAVVELICIISASLFVLGALILVALYLARLFGWE